ncbi:hypothetical protein JVX91_12870 [Pseudomonas sp. PDNC002]|uniref:hypothetical protein n=1 Tax=Pseudomonas sp. PDNC002 TaxID=2811422 RepID=UPI00196457E7|nr:hypothetical protein [Pseudomonas sp. PDNC002]QRY81947.1 hypothetical protein JVX91_12870 [Pseudomonas sp. PDNC002]
MKPRKFSLRDAKSSAPVKPSVWNSLEVTKIVIAALTPIMVGCVGYLIQSEVADQAQERRTSERLVDRRLAVYDEIRLNLNRIYCFIDDVGTWKEETPEKIYAYRRQIHAVMHSNRAIWSSDTFEAYSRYMDQIAFETFQGVGQDASIRTIRYQKEHGIPGWRAEWSERLTDEKDPAHSEAYAALQKLISRDLQLNVPEVRSDDKWVGGGLFFNSDESRH